MKFVNAYVVRMLVSHRKALSVINKFIQFLWPLQILAQWKTRNVRFYNRSTSDINEIVHKEQQHKKESVFNTSISPKGLAWIQSVLHRSDCCGWHRSNEYIFGYWADIADKGYQGLLQAIRAVHPT